MKIVTSGCTFHAATTGREKRNGIFLLHGFLGSGNDWQYYADRLRENFDCIMPDLPGHGTTLSTDMTPRSFEEIAGQLAEAASRCHPCPLHLVGYSMGGRLALYLALHYPGIFRSAVIISSSPGLNTAAERDRRMESDSILAESIRDNYHRFLYNWYNLTLFEPLKQHHLFPEVLQRRYTNNPAALADALEEMSTGRQPSLWEKLRENKLPVNFFVGEKDTKYVEIGRQMVNLCPYSELVIFPGCGHTLHIENRQLFLDRLVAFLARIP